MAGSNVPDRSAGAAAGRVSRRIILALASCSAFTLDSVDDVEKAEPHGIQVAEMDMS